MEVSCLQCFLEKCTKHYNRYLGTEKSGSKHGGGPLLTQNMGGVPLFFDSKHGWWFHFLHNEHDANDASCRMSMMQTMQVA
jgi:hypothetical protein